MRKIFTLFICGLLLINLPETAAQTSVSVVAGKDNTIFSENGARSNGSGKHLFAGRTNTTALRRALVYFNLNGLVPEGATVDSASLRMVANKGLTFTALPFSIHRLTSGWGEAGSAASGEEGAGAAAETGDATWANTFFDTDNWSSSGGDFEAVATQTADVEGNGEVVWRGNAVTDDVKLWLSDSSKNHGWILVGNEESTKSAKRFTSRENDDLTARPTLTIWYTEQSTGIGSFAALDMTSARAYPNPFTDLLTIEYSVMKRADVNVEIFNLLGQQVLSELQPNRNPGKYEYQLDVNSHAGEQMPHGMYYVILSSGDSRKVMKVLKAR